MARTPVFGSQLGMSHAGYLYGRAGVREMAETLLDSTLALSRREYVKPLHIAMIYCGLGEADSAFAWLERAYQARADDLVYFYGDCLGLKDDPRFADLARRIGHPAY